MDPWVLAGLPGRLGIASYLTADQYAAQYRVIVDALLDIQGHSLTGVGRDDLEAAVRERIAAFARPELADRLTAPDVFDLDRRLEALAGDTWRVIIGWQSRATTDAEFLRSRDRYQLTARAADLHRWLRCSIDDDSLAISAAAFAPAVIEERLREMLAAVEQEDARGAAKA